MYVIYPRKDAFNINLLVNFVLKWQAGYSSFFFVLMARLNRLIELNKLFERNDEFVYIYTTYYYPLPRMFPIESH